MGLTLASRLLLRKVLVLRRISSTPITIAFLVPALVEDEALIKEHRPDLYIDSVKWGAREVLEDCIEDGTVEHRLGPPGGHDTVARTKLGDQFIRGLEPLLAQLADEAPMSGKNLLDWLARM
jgi:hypothetical protein